jgi:uncharacterized lipoprotein YbaY
MQSAQTPKVLTKGRGTSTQIALKPVETSESASAQPSASESSDEAGNPNEITGEITWGNPYPMPDGRLILIKLLQPQGSDGAVKTVASKGMAITKRTAKPIRFAMPFNPRDVRPTQDCMVQVDVIHKGELSMQSAQTPKVLTKGRGTSANIALEPAD